MTQERKSSRPQLLQSMIDAFRQTDLRRKMLITLGILVLFRFIAHVPVPGLDPSSMREFMGGGSSAGALFGMLNMFSGGAMEKLSIATMGVYPYITATIIMQLMVPVIPKLRELSSEGESGRAKINIYTHWLTVPLALLQGYSQLTLLQKSQVISGIGFSGGDALPTISMLLAMTAGTMFLVWLGELITEYGIGNGVSLIIFAGIVCDLPKYIGYGALENNVLGMVLFAILSLVILVTIIIFTEAQRHIPVQYARSLYRGGKVYRQSGGTHIPIRVNSGGMIPIIFAMSFMLMPGIIAGFFVSSDASNPNFANSVVNLFSSTGWFYWIMYFFLVVALTFFYTTVIFQQQNLAETLQRQGAFIPGIRPGKTTHQYLSKVSNRITWGGALFLGIVTISPFIIQKISGIQGNLQLPAVGMIIVVGVALDTMRQLEAQLLMRKYEGFLK